MSSSIVTLTVNGVPRELLARPGTTLLDALRDTLGLTAAKKGCGQGTCGTCTVLLEGKPVFGCLVPVETISGARVETLEGLAAQDPKGGDTLHPLQQAFIERFATQCGFCTSGMIMAAKALLRDNASPSRDDIARAISGNVCRCTGYEAIIDAIGAAAAQVRKAKTPNKKPGVQRRAAE